MAFKKACLVLLIATLSQLITSTNGLSGRYLGYLVDNLDCGLLAWMCSDTVEPVCCEGKQTVRNLCYATRKFCYQVNDCERGECPDNGTEQASSRRNARSSSAPCPKSAARVCCQRQGATRRHTVRNMCIATKRRGFADANCEPGACPRHQAGPNRNPQARGACACSFSNSPVCCRGKETQRNQCRARCAGFKVLQECVAGSCPDTSSGCNCEEGAGNTPVCCLGNKYESACDAQCNVGSFSQCTTDCTTMVLAQSMGGIPRDIRRLLNDGERNGYPGGRVPRGATQGGRRGKRAERPQFGGTSGPDEGSRRARRSVGESEGKLLVRRSRRRARRRRR